MDNGFNAKHLNDLVKILIGHEIIQTYLNKYHKLNYL